MMLELAVLGGVAVLLSAAIWARREILLLVAVLTYAGATSWLLQRDLGLLLPALGVAILLGLLGIGLTLRAEVAAQKVTTQHGAFKVSTNNMAEADNIGQ